MSTRTPFMVQALGVASLVAAVSCWSAAYVSPASPDVVSTLAALGVVLLALGAPSGARIRSVVLASLTALTATLLLDRFEIQFDFTLHIVGQLSAWLLSLQYGQVEMVSGKLELLFRDELVQVVPHTTFIGLREAVLTLAVALTVLASQAGRSALSALPWAIVSALGALVLRFTWCTVRYLHSTISGIDSNHLDISQFWSLSAILVTVVPLTLALYALVAIQTAEPEVEEGAPPRRPTLAFAGVALGFATALLLGFRTSGSPTQGRVMMDDRMSGVWEPAGRLLTRDRYGDFSAYSFAAMTESIARRYELTVNSDRKYDRETLADTDVLILKTPHEAFEPAEVAAIQEWTEAGGGLFLIGDHTDLSGMNTHLNAISSRWGLAFENDALDTSDIGGFVQWSVPYWVPHPIAAGLPVFGYMTGCSLTGGPGATPVMPLERTVGRAGDYSQNSNFGTVPPRPTSPQGALAGVLAQEVGDGRVVLFSDSTVFSSFAFPVDGHTELVERSLAWLGRSGSAGTWLMGFAALGILAAAGFQLRRAAPSRRGGSLVAALGLGTFLVTIGPISELSGATLRAPEPWLDVPRAGLVTEGGVAVMPPVLGSQPEGTGHYNFMSLAQIPLRLGMEVEVVPREASVLDDLDVVMILNPDLQVDPTGPSAEWLAALDAFVSKGGTVIVMTSNDHEGHDHASGSVYLEGKAFEPYALDVPGASAEVASVGQGHVVHIAGSQEFAVQGLGHCMAHPDPDQMLRYESMYALFDAFELGQTDQERQIYWPSVEERERLGGGRGLD